MKLREKKNIYILRKDLRQDSKFLNNSIFYYFWNETNFSKENRGQSYKDNLKRTLAALKNEIEVKGGYLEIIQGGIIDRIKSVVSDGFQGQIYIERQYLPWEKEEEGYLLKNFPKRVKLIEKDFLLTVPGEVLKDDGKPYVMFTPFYKKWQKVLYHKNHEYTEINVKSLEIERFFSEKINNYSIDRDFPWKDATSKFSKELNLGVFSPLDIFKYSFEFKNNIPDSGVFIRQLAWRDFYYHLYYFFPHVLTSSFKEKYKDIYWENNKEYFAKWTKGQTGFPFVDAGMRQLVNEGFMHNRLRMITASFLTKDLLIDWKKGAEFFMNHLVDGDVLLNNGGWQWSASTGADSQPYFRIFNPVTQSKKFDLEGKYIKKHLPELKNVPIKYIHEPLKMPEEEQKKYGFKIGRDYPYPMVDHKEQRLKALELYKI